MGDISYLAEAIKVAENDPKRFGVRSVKVNSPKEADRVLINSIKNNLRRWKEQGKPGKFVDFMHTKGGPWGTGWAPIGAKNDPDNLNQYWAGNVRSALKKMLPSGEYDEWKKRNLVMNSSTAEAIRRS